MASLCLDFRDGGQQIILVCPGSAMSLAYQMDLVLEIKAAGVLGMAAIDDEDKRRHIAGGGSSRA